eukprot:TRINITY_DN2551_c0_g1_i1.p1 TRINITY_DN2551_c0_g1~~TRINITY_DN2551_c0_g1_i1.p1  ORF type:complete len:411 (+),score=149.55 TRINITY_DN2551_c0_g1_i1:172-1404(+)
MSRVAMTSCVTIIKQHSPFEEKVTRNGIQRDIHVVIKNSPFTLQLGAATHDIDFNRVAFDAALLYDTEGEKGVDFVKMKPIEFKCMPNEKGDQTTIELRIKVLTSQHEDMFFKVRIQGQDPVTKQELPHIKVITAPIKVISKPEQLKKRQNSVSTPTPLYTPITPLPISPTAINTPSSSSCSSTITSTSSASKKRTVNELVVDAVNRIEKSQQDQQTLLEKIYQQVSLVKQESGCGSSSTSSAVPSSSSPSFFLEFMNKSKDSLPSGSKEDDFETTFVQLLKAYSAIDPSSRATKIRRISRNLTPSQNESFSELMDMFSSEGAENTALGREAKPVIMSSNLSMNGSMDSFKYLNTQHHHHMPTQPTDTFFFPTMMNYPNLMMGMNPGEEEYTASDFLVTSPGLNSCLPDF